MKTISGLYVILISLVLVNACSSSKSEDDVPTLTHEIIMGSGGGFTGSSSGYSIDTLGNVFRWEGITFSNARKKFIGKLNINRIDELNSFIESSNILETKYNNPGNMTTYVSLVSGNTKNQYSWQEGTDLEKVPVNVLTLFNKIIELVKSTDTE